jgi:hypothetical protein
MKKLQSLTYLIAILPFIALIIFFTSCTKEGPMGPAGKDGVNGTNGTNGVNGGTTCQTCHNGKVVESMATQFELSKHSYGVAAEEEAGNTSCGPCHLSEAFKYVCENNIPSTFTLTAGKYVNDYASIATEAYGPITCFTCHNKLHTKYDTSDLESLTNTAAVKMTMWAGALTIDLAQKGGTSNLCVKCHQPRPFTASNQDGRVLNYDSLKSFPTAIFYDSAIGKGKGNQLIPGYRTHTHYGVVGAVFAGKGAVEFPGSEPYANSTHTTVAACQDCHMSTMSGKAGGHSFFIRSSSGGLTSSTTWNFNGCNASGCHDKTGPVSATNTGYWTFPRNTIKGLLEQLAAKLVENGTEIMNKSNDAEANLWYGLTSKNYDGYLNVFDPVNNPTNTTGCFQNASPSSSWSAADKAKNLTFPKLHLTNAQMGAIINFQFCLREYSLGIHNYKYSKALLTNTIAKL